MRSKRKEDVERVIRSLGCTLAPHHQQVITLRYLAGLDPDEAALAMGCSKATLAVTLHKRSTLRRTMVDSPPTGPSRPRRSRDETSVPILP